MTEGLTPIDDKTSDRSQRIGFFVNIPSGAATLLAAAITVGGLVGLHVYAENEKELEISRALYAEVSAIRESVQGICLVLPQVIDNKSSINDSGSMMLSPERKVWDAYADKLGFLPVSQGKTISWFYGLHKITLEKLNDPSVSPKRKLGIAVSLSGASDKAIETLEKVTGNKYKDDKDRLWMENGKEPCSSEVSYVSSVWNQAVNSR